MRELLGLRLEGGVHDHCTRLSQCTPGPQELQQRLLCAAILGACISMLQCCHKLAFLRRLPSGNVMSVYCKQLTDSQA
jgi:hypothetical protein